MKKQHLRLVMVLLTVGSARGGHTQVFTWTGMAAGNSTSWASPDNWNVGGGLVPGSHDAAYFDSNTRTTTTSAGGRLINSITFGTGATATRTISGGSVLFFDPNGDNSGVTTGVSGVAIENLSTATHAFTLAVGLSGPETFSATAGGLTFSGGITLGANQLTLTGGQGINVNSTISSGGGSLVKQGAGTLTLSGTAANTFSGPVTLAAGTLILTKAGALGSVSAVNINAGVLSLQGVGLSHMGASSAINLAGGTIIANNSTESVGALSLSGDATIALADDTTAGILRFASGARTGGTLTVENWSGTAGQSGTDDQIFFTSAPDAGFLGHVQFVGFQAAAVLLGSGELVPIPEPPQVALVIGLGLVLFTVQRRHASRWS